MKNSDPKGGPYEWAVQECSSSHELIREFIVSSLGKREAARLHFDLMLKLERCYPERDLKKHALELFWHAIRARDCRLRPTRRRYLKARIWRYFSMALEQVEFRHSIDEAFTICEAFLASTPAARQRAVAGLALTRIELQRGRLQEGVRRIESALRAARRAKASGLLAQGLALRGHLMHLKKGPNTGESDVREAIQYFRRVGDNRREGDCLAELGAIEFGRANHASAANLFKASETKHRVAGNLAGVLRALASYAGVLRKLGDLNQSLECYNEVIQLAEVENDSMTMAAAYGDRATVLCDMGQHGEALKDYARSAELARVCGNLSVIANTLINRACTLEAMGKVNDALALYDQAARAVDEVGALRLKSRVVGNKASLLILLRDFSGAAQLLLESEKIAADSGDRDQLIYVHSNRGVMHGWMGEFELAFEDFSHAVELARQGAQKLDLAIELVNLADTCCDLQRYEVAISNALEALDLFDETGAQSSEWVFRNLTVAARAEHGRHNNGDAAMLAREALELAQRLDLQSRAGDPFMPKTLEMLRQYSASSPGKVTGVV